jgi:phytoene dehydrogenase-like protein
MPSSTESSQIFSGRTESWTSTPGEQPSGTGAGSVDVTTGLEDAQRDFERARAGEPAVGFGEIYFQTGYDPSPAPPGKHLMSVFGQYAPYDMDWDGRREEVTRQFIDLIARFAPDFEACIEHYEVLGPPTSRRGSASPAATSSRAT